MRGEKKREFDTEFIMNITTMTITTNSTITITITITIITVIATG
jgi:hypothetical protein